MQLLKHLIKKYLWQLVFYGRITGRGPRMNHEFEKALTVSAALPGASLNIFTSDDEDGILLYLFSRIGHGERTFVDIGSNDCINSNCANLAFHHNWGGIFIDGNTRALSRGSHIYKRHFKKETGRFSFIHSVVTPSNINAILKNALAGRGIDLLSIDLDGNDYFLWKSITVVKPRLVLIEVQVEKGDSEFIPSYNNAFEPYEGNQPKGASPLSMLKLARTKGYRLVAANKGCYNLFFTREDCMNGLKEITLEEALKNA